MNDKSLKSIEKIIIHAQKAIDYSSMENWWEDNKSLEAIVFNLAQIGELVRFVDDDVLTKYAGINWPALKGLRNRIIHDYDYVKPLVIKSIVQNDLPKLVNDLESIIDQE